MSYTDEVFVRNSKRILSEGSSDEGLEVRPHWPDGTPAHTKMIFNQADTYFMQQGESVPVMTLRQLNFRACVDEILWIYQKTSNNVHDLNSHIWDAWADEEGSIGSAYGFQIRKEFRHHKAIEGEDLSDYPSAITDDEWNWVWMNQIDAAIYDLRNHPTDRGIITNMFNHFDLADMNLRPCAYSMTFNVQHCPDGTRYLHALLNQRSQDMLTANGWNVTQYAVLTQMIAQVCGLKARSLTHMVANMHIYDRHEDIVREMIETYERGESQTTPRFWINPEIKSFKDFTVDDVKLIDYEACPFEHKIEVAI